MEKGVSESWEQLRLCVVGNLSITESLIPVLRQLKREEVPQKTVQEYLNRLRTDFPSKEDYVLEALDIVSGWCRPVLKVW
jgi:hypothetical protein